jgi:Arf-GAP/GTPase/ANK repeat/PH domain-containing protein 1/3
MNNRRSAGVVNNTGDSSKPKRMSAVTSNATPTTGTHMTPGIRDRIDMINRRLSEDTGRSPGSSPQGETGIIMSNHESRSPTNAQTSVVQSLAIRQEIQRFESVHPSIYAVFDLLDQIPDPMISNQIREHVVNIEGELNPSLFYRNNAHKHMMKEGVRQKTCTEEWSLNPIARK